MARAPKAVAKPPAEQTPADQAQAAQPAPLPPPGKTAIVVIHGIGEQRPLETLGGFVETVYRRDRALASLGVGDTGMLDIAFVPDDVSGSAELRRITTLNDGPQKRTDFFEFYWADIMDGTPVDMVIGWIRALVLRSPWRLPASLKVKRAWAILAVVFATFTLAGLVSAGMGMAQLTDGAAPDLEHTAYLDSIRLGLVALVLGAGLVWLLVASWREGFEMRRAALGWPAGTIVAGLALWAIPATLLGSLPFWAAVLATLAGSALHKLVTPFAGDVVRYVRATPATVERRRLVRERGLALLEALHKKRLDGTTLEAFTQAGPDNPPLYDRIVLVGHSLGTIIAYDLVQLFWEKYGPTHHQQWDFADAGIQSALRDCDAFVQAAWGEAPRPVDAVAFETARAKLFEQIHKARPGWRISDLITLGSPLTHAEFLLADSQQEIDAATVERRLATSPPHPDVKLGRQDSMLHLAPGADARTSKKPAKVPHFAAQFAAVRWTNIYDEDNNPLMGDLISGRLAGSFGPAIVEHPVVISRPDRSGLLRRIFTHTQYWTWHPSYEPSAENAAADNVQLALEARRALVWHRVPEHIRLLRQVLRLGE